MLFCTNGPGLLRFQILTLRLFVCLQGNYFLVSDQSPKVDVLQTLKEFKAANFHKAQGKAPVFASGQPTFHGLKRVMQKFQDEGHQVGIYSRCLKLVLWSVDGVL